MERRVAIALWLSVIVFANRTVPAAPCTTETVYLLTVLPYPNSLPTLHPSWDEGPDVIPAAQLAVEHVNNRTDVLSCYKLELINTDGGCDVTSKASISFTEAILQPDRHKSPVGIIGPGCSFSTLEFGHLSNQETITLINVHLATLPVLQNRILYPYTFGVLASTYELSDAIFALMKNKNWKRVAALYDASRVAFLSNYRKFESDFADEIPGGKLLFSSEVFNTYLPLTTIRESLARIVILFLGPEYSRRIMCLAYHKGMLYSAYQWIITGRQLQDYSGSDVVFTFEGNMYTCTREIMVNVALRGNIFINYQVTPNDPNATTVAGISYNEYLSEYQDRVNEYNSNDANLYRNITLNIWGTITYDAVWAMALALDKATDELNLATYRYGQREQTDKIQKQFHNLEFDGMSGHISFNPQKGFTKRISAILQVFDGREDYVAFHNVGSIVEIDSFPTISDQVDQQPVTIVTPLSAVFATALAIQLVVIAFTHILIVAFRNYKHIKASSPRLNHLIYIGSYVLGAGALIYAIFKAVPMNDQIGNIVVCQLPWLWFFPAGFTLVFGTLAGRTWRLYRIFTHFTDPGKFISDPVLAVFVLLLLLVDITVSIVWTMTDPLHFEIIMETQSIEMVGSVQIQKIVLSRGCTADFYVLWCIVVYGYKLVILIMVVTLALLTRKIHNQTFTTNSLRILVYLISLQFGLGIPLYYVIIFLYLDLHIDYSVVCVELTLILLLILVFVFLPPVVPLLREKSRKVFLSLHQYTTNIDKPKTP